ncbi:retrotransposon protein, putative, ty1-copia subclass [Tanacetum coccineum]
MYVIEQPLPHASEPVAEPDIMAHWTALYDAHTEIACLMLGSMTPELHRQFELHYPYDTVKELPAKDDVCHHYKEVGHWKRNCPVYLAELQKKRKQVGSASSSGIFTIELFSFPNNNSWVYDTGCGTNICITKQGFRIERKLKQGALYLYMGNGVRAQVEAIESFDLVLPNGLVIFLDNCHYAPTITRGVVSVSRLVDIG